MVVTSLDVCIIHCISGSCMMTSFYSIQYVKIAESDCCQIMNIYVHLHTFKHVFIPRFDLRDEVVLRPLKLYFNITDIAKWITALDI